MNQKLACLGKNSRLEGQPVRGSLDLLAMGLSRRTSCNWESLNPMLFVKERMLFWVGPLCSLAKVDLTMRLSLGKVVVSMYSAGCLVGVGYVRKSHCEY